MSTPGLSDRNARRAPKQRSLGLRIRESCCEYTGSKFQEHSQTVFGSHNNGRACGGWSDDDYDVFDGDRHIGRILLTHAAN